MQSEIRSDWRLRDIDIGFKANTDFVYRSILNGGTIMRRFIFFLVAVATTAGLVAFMGPDGQSVNTHCTPRREPRISI
jgi:hypothetical protein